MRKILPQLPALIELRNFACERDERILFSALNVCFYAGQVVQILGANGSGKTTLLRILAGVSSDYQGDILWQGQSLRQGESLRQGVAREDCAWEYAAESLYLGHMPGIKKSLTPLENLRWYASIQGAQALQGDELLLQALAEVGLNGYADTLCYQLSAGQLRRVALARLVFSKAKLWLLDEPFTALDKAGVALLEARLANHAAAGGLILVTSHQDINIPHLQLLNLQDYPAPQQAFAGQEVATHG